MSENKAVNIGIAKRQENQRRATLNKIDIAIAEIAASGRKITKTLLAEEIEMSRDSLRAPYIKKHLNKYPQFNKGIPETMRENENSQLEIARLNQSIEKLNASQRRLEKKSNTLLQENRKLKNELSILKEKYRIILGEYQQQEPKTKNLYSL
ncbi:MAG: hypothetical protein QMB62_11410 [Oscillospiraceae bacterium]